jgi:ATP-dependent RNA helicase RhlE
MQYDTFDSFEFHEDLASGIQAMGYKSPTPIQQQAIPMILEEKDLIACAQTGTGKTAAYLLPLLNKISHARHDHTSTLVLVPTRELAKQIDDQVEGFAYFVSATSIAIYGGTKGDSWDQQKRALTSGADIIIATPGRLIAHMNMGYVKLDKLEYLVLDEADKMLDMGFMDDIMRIVRELPQDRQTLMFSATMPPKIRDFARKILQSPAEISLAVSKPAAGIDQRSYLVYDNQKLPLLQHLMKDVDVQSMVIFTSRKSAVNEIVRAVVKMGHSAEGISSDRTQEEREATMQGFRNKKFKILVATDILSRGIDVDNISHVLNFDVPHDAEDYVHRIGRTARASTTGTAITFINDKEMYRIARIESLIEKELPKLPLPEGFGPGPEYSASAKRPSGQGRDRNKRGGSGGSSGGGNRNRRPAAAAPKTPEHRSDNGSENKAATTAEHSTREHGENKSRNRDRNKRRRNDRPAPDPNRPVVAAKPRPSQEQANPE